MRLYARSEQAPPLFRQLRNVPELERRYRAFELSFEKRMSHGWQLAGTLILSRSEGNAGVASGGQFAGSSSAGIAMPGNMNGPAVPSWVPWSGTGSLEGPGYGNGSAAYPGGITGPSAIFVDPNSFINRWGRLDTDRPVVFSLHGAIEVPLGFLLSASFHYQSGRPWQRWARILPPAEWAAANGVERIYYAVNLEPGGSRREPAWSALNLRVEKNWKAGAAGRFRLAADVMNILGHKASIEGLNDVDIWEPAAEGANKPGLLTPAPDYGKTHALLGKRLLRITFAFVF
ncbi:MAG: hypothetical protein FJY81_06890 [Candidatus Aminicenantes bacterium]|nr:hypothetical protein [Candidatus Aminicenantes bacterium]